MRPSCNGSRPLDHFRSGSLAFGCDEQGIALPTVEPIICDPKMKKTSTINRRDLLLGASPAATFVILGAELSLGLGITFGFLTPVALFASILLNLVYFVLMIHDWAEQGQNLMMVLAAAVALGTHSWQVWSIDHLIHIFGA